MHTHAISVYMYIYLEFSYFEFNRDLDAVWAQVVPPVKAIDDALCSAILAQSAYLGSEKLERKGGGEVTHRRPREVQMDQNWEFGGNCQY